MAGYKVLYRKYRPRFFADVVGQPQVTLTLKNELMRGRIAHAYLFTGSRGTGKTTCAKILARAVNCLNPVDGDPCGECEICRGLEDGSILDVVEIDAASNNGVESVRAIIEETNFTPASAKYRVYIIDEVHMLSVAAFNALLKTLEEPPAHVVFILATTEVHRLLPTILSRCQRFDFHRIDPELMADRLMQVAEKEDAQLERTAAVLLARIADGALRDALSLLDQCLGRSRQVTPQVVYETAGLASREYLAGMAQAVAQRDAAAALEAVDRLHKSSKDLGRLCSELCEYFRGLMLCKTMRDPGPLLQLPEDELAAMEELSKSMSLPDVLHGLDAFEEAMNRMRFGSQRTVLEMTFVRLCSPELDSTPEALLRRLEALERGGIRAAPPALPEASPVPSSPAPEHEAPPSAEQDEMARLLAELSDSPAPKPAVQQPERAKPLEFKPPKPPAPKEPQKPEPKQQIDLEALAAGAERLMQWPDILQVLSGNMSVAMAFAGSTAYVSGDYILIDAPEIAFDMLKKSRERDRLRDAIRQVTGRVYKLGPYRKSSGADPGNTGSANASNPMDDLLKRAESAGIPVRQEDEQP